MTDCGNFFLIALGSNLQSIHGAPAQTLVAALMRLAQEGAQITAVSRFYRSPAFPAGAGPDYVNACAALRVPGPVSPAEMLERLHRIEAEMGRQRLGRWQSRPIDLDLIAAEDRLLPDPDTHRHWRTLPLAEQMRRAPAQPIVPHPRLQDRAFVLIPLAEIAPQWRHPVTGHSVTDMLHALPKSEFAALTPICAPLSED